MSTKAKTNPKAKAKNEHSVVWFEVPADNVERARKFYGTLFGWKIEKFPGGMEYWHIDTGGADATPDGGMMKRQHPQHGITTYISVPSVEKFMVKVQKLGGNLHAQDGGAADGLLRRLPGP